MADLQSIIDRAAAATNRFGEADAVQHAVAVLAPDRRGLVEICKEARMGNVPRACLLGVVASLVPEGARFTVDSGSGVVLRHNGMGHVVPLPVAETATLRLLVAICRALQAQGSASHD